VGLSDAVPELLRETGGAVPALEVVGKRGAVLVLELQEMTGTEPVLELREIGGAVPEKEVVPVISSQEVVLLVYGGVSVDIRGVEELGPVVIGTVPEDATPVLQTIEDERRLDLEIVGTVRVLFLLALLENEKDAEVVIGTEFCELGDEGKAEVLLSGFEVSVTTEVMIVGVVTVMTVVLADDVGVGSVTEDDGPVERSVSVPVGQREVEILVVLGIGEDEILVPNLGPRFLGTWSSHERVSIIYYVHVLVKGMARTSITVA
jgi:hypothetical protein